LKKNSRGSSSWVFKIRRTAEENKSGGEVRNKPEVWIESVDHAPLESWIGKKKRRKKLSKCMQVISTVGREKEKMRDRFLQSEIIGSVCRRSQRGGIRGKILPFFHFRSE